LFLIPAKISFVTGQIVGGEALLRWVKPGWYRRPPNLFLAQAEKSGFTTNITAVMLPELVKTIEKVKAIKTDTQMAFNISTLDLYSPYLVKMLRSFIGSKRINPGNIQIELTGSAVVVNSERISMPS
jgi:sensor c-di-GMP phosphodiesterase-like protein